MLHDVVDGWDSDCELWCLVGWLADPSLPLSLSPNSCAWDIISSSSRSSLECGQSLAAQFHVISEEYFVLLR
jgi:hypothetical protein